jgi:hypothetical protein
MRGIKAKRLRKEVYGDTSLKIQRQYIGGRKSEAMDPWSPVLPVRNHPDSLRAKYQLAKKGDI